MDLNLIILPLSQHSLQESERKTSPDSCPLIPFIMENRFRCKKLHKVGRNKKKSAKASLAVELKFN